MKVVSLLSKLQSMLPMCKLLIQRPCKVGTKYLEDGTKVRVSRGIGASGSIIPRPEILKIRTTPRPSV
ncbi:50S ribosomal protein l24-like, partial [Trifolium pratense]